jgi:predicted type IV restriction endonuclease
MQNEAFSRVFIEKALEFSGWNLLDPKEVRFEFTIGDKRADYVLSGQRWPLSVLEAKREDIGPYDARKVSVNDNVIFSLLMAE